MTINSSIENRGTTLMTPAVRTKSINLRRVAIMVDWENMEVPRRKGEIGNLKQKQLIRIISQYGNARGVVSVATAVAGFRERDERAMWLLNVHGIVPQITMNKKVNGQIQPNAADIHLVVEAVSALMKDPSITDFILFSGDGGFLPLLRLLRSQGKKVTIVGSTADSISAHLKREADNWTTIAELIGYNKEEE